jgi:hypothetical protein
VHDDLDAVDGGLDPLARWQGPPVNIARAALSTRTSRPAARSRGTTRRPRVPVPAVTRITVLMVKPFGHIGALAPV